jgi:SsrA-binding protein
MDSTPKWEKNDAGQIYFISGETITAKSANKKLSKDDPNEKVIAHNRRARFEYDVLETLECGIVLVGSEVKSLRAGNFALEDGYAKLRDGELYLLGCDIQEYSYANQMNHVTKRARKLLLHRRELRTFAGRAKEKQLTLVPLKMYFKEGRAKVLLGLCRGRKLHDKRDVLKEKTMQREIDRAMRRK